MLSCQSLPRPIHGGNLIWAASVAQCSSGELLDFSASISPLGPPESVMNVLSQSLRGLSAYPNPDYAALCRRLALHHQVDAGWVLPGNGVAELLTWAGRELAGCDRTYLLTPAFGDYSRALNGFGAAIAAFPIELGSFPATIHCPLPELTASCGILINNPHNPTGLLLKASELLPLLESGGLVVVDEAFMDFLWPEQQQSVMPWIQRFPNLVVLRSLTKFYSLAGLRLGYAILHPDRAARWRQWRDPWPVNHLAALAMETVLDDEAFQRQTWAWLSTARQQLVEGLRMLPGLAVYPGAANFLLVQSDVSCSQLQEALLRQHRIFIRDCLSFPGLGDRFFRIAVRTESENQRLLTALAAALEELHEQK